MVLDLNGTIVEGSKKPSSEWGLHAAMYKVKPEARAAVHTHSLYCTVLACLREPIRAVHYVVADAGVPCVPCAPYRTFGTPALAEAASEAIGDSNAVLLANHGILAVGKDLPSAFSLATAPAAAFRTDCAPAHSTCDGGISRKLIIGNTLFLHASKEPYLL